MDAEQLQLIKTHLPAGLFRSILVGEELTEFWEKTPIDPMKDWDLNPHLYIIQVCEEIAQHVAVHTPCTKEDVMLQWLTMAVHNGMFLPK